MKKISIMLYIFLFLIAFKLVSSFIINEHFILKYDKGIYEEKSIKYLFFINVFEPCVARYNYGNILYQNKDYDKAIEEYNKALQLFPSKKQECSIRINLALAMLNKIDFENEEKEEIFEKLNEAKNILCETGCANLNDDNGHSKEAEILKKDIENMQNELQNESTDKKDEKDESKENQNTQEKNVEEKLKQIQKEGIEERQDALESVNRLENYEYYNGKKW